MASRSTEEMFDTILNLGNQLKGVLDMLSGGVHQGGEIVGQCNEGVVRRASTPTSASASTWWSRLIQDVFDIFESLGFLTHLSRPPGSGRDMGTQGPVGRGSWVLRFAVTVRPLAARGPRKRSLVPR